MDISEQLVEVVKVSNGFKPMKELADRLANQQTDKELAVQAHKLFESTDYQIRMVAVFLFGKLAAKDADSLNFLQEIVAKDENWRVQEILAMAFDNFCKDTGYEESLATIKSWLTAEDLHTRRAASEGLRIWTSRPYFKENPEVAIHLLALLKNDDSEYVRKSCGNALRDISKKFPEKVLHEISKWGTSKNESQVKKLILKNKKLLTLD